MHLARTKDMYVKTQDDSLFILEPFKTLLRSVMLCVFGVFWLAGREILIDLVTIGPTRVIYVLLTLILILMKL